MPCQIILSLLALKWMCVLLPQWFIVRWTMKDLEEQCVDMKRFPTGKKFCGNFKDVAVRLWGGWKQKDSHTVAGKIVAMTKKKHIIVAQSFIWRSWRIWGRQCICRGLRRGQTRPWLCTCSHVDPDPWRSLQTTRWLSSPRHPTLQIWS